MSVFPIVKGVRLRATKINSCGLPIAGAANRLVTDGFVTVTIAAVMKDRDELEQTNAEGKVCVTDSTPPQRKYYTVAAELCNVNTGLISMFNGWDQVIDYKADPVGFRDAKDVESDYGVAIEVWTGGKDADDCPLQETDDIFASPSSGKSYGYFLLGATEFTLGDVTIGAQISTLTLTGITLAMSQWGRGPYNVVATDGSNTPGRLLTPLNSTQHFHIERTPIAPPAVTPGTEPVALDISTIFQPPGSYFGGPGGAPAVDVAPDQPSDSGS